MTDLVVRSEEGVAHIWDRTAPIVAAALDTTTDRQGV